VLRRLSDFESAVESYRKALELDSTYAWAWNGLGLAYAALEEWDKANAACEKAVQYNPNDVWFWHNYGETLMAIEDYRRAVDALETALLLDPQHEPSMQKLRLARGKFEENQ
jgi:tetratricopeptide (TPR) repeat protein